MYICIHTYVHDRVPGKTRVEGSSPTSVERFSTTTKESLVSTCHNLIISSSKVDNIVIKS